jgi:LacI family transcriptional regulator
MKSHQVTIVDIARELNIAPSTVSRALKGNPRISPETRRAVIELATKSNYQPNSVALSLVKSKTNTIGIIIPEIAHHFFSSAISGIEDIAYAAGYNVMICQSNESFEREVVNTQALISSRVDGLIVSMAKSTQNFDHFEKLNQKGIPLIFFDRVCDALATSRVLVDDYEGAYTTVEHLISVGCRRIAHLAGPPNLLISQNRLRGYRDALIHNQLPFEEDMIIHCDTTLQNGIEAAKTLLQFSTSVPGKQLPDGIFTVSDMVGIGAMLAIKDMGLRIPDDIAVAGFANDRYSSFFEPSLTAVEQPAFEMGQTAARLFLKQMATPPDEFVPETSILKTRLIIRNSSRKSAV